MKTKPVRAKRFLAATLASLTLCGSVPLHAQTSGLIDPYQADFKKSLAGKTVAFVPLAMSFDLSQGWAAELKKDLEPLGVKVVIRDPNWNTGAGAQALSTLITEKPDVIIVHNPDVQTYVRLIQRAEQAGIHVLQINLGSNYRTDAYVGPDWVQVGEKAAEAVVNQCKGKSNKIAITQTTPSATVTAYQLIGINNVLAKHPEIKVVSNQPADNDASKAKAIMQTVLKQHPDLCGVIGFWDGMDIGTAAAIREAGLTGKVFNVSSGGGEQRGACDQIKSGAFDLYLNYDAPEQARTMVTMIEWLLQSPGVKSGAGKGALYSKLIPLDKAAASADGACWKLSK